MSEDTPVDRKKLSHVPSWIMLGFVLGVVVMFGYRSRGPAAVSALAAPVVEEGPAPGASETNSLAIQDQPSFTVVEALFEEFRQYAFWDDERTEIALWNTRTLEFSDYFEVLRGDEGTYFRSIRQLSRLPLRGYGPPNCPILFTETAAQRARRLQDRKADLPRPAPPPPVDLPRIVRPQDGP